MGAPHMIVAPASLYLATPVILVSTVNEDDGYNLAPVSSAFWLGSRCVLGLEASSKTAANISRTGELSLNLPSEREAMAIDRLRNLTGMHPVPPAKLVRGYISERRKFEAAGLTPVPSRMVTPPRALECPIQIEATVINKYGALAEGADWDGAMTLFEVRLELMHVHPEVLTDGDVKRIDPDKWQPLASTYQDFTGIAQGRSGRLRLNRLDLPDRPHNPERARQSFRLVT